MPYTDTVLGQLADSGKRKIVVATPSFVSDCLESLEEIGIEGKETFLSADGESFHLAPALNNNPDWVNALVKMVDSKEDWSSLDTLLKIE